MTAVRYYLDEHLSPQIGAALRRAGVACVTTQDAGRLGAHDEDNVRWCNDQDMVVVTHDDDYLRIVSGRADHAGIAYCRRPKYGPSGLIRALIRLAGNRTAEELRGTVEYL